MIKASVSSIALAAPGIIGPEQAGPILRGEAGWVREDYPNLPVPLLPANEKRRTSPTIRLALHVANEACLAAKTKPAAMVFASMSGDTVITDRLCQALDNEDIALSPIQFHNSVHNAPAGYWSIASKSQATSTSISAGKATFTAGLIESMVMVVNSNKPVLYVAYDYPAPEPMNKARKIAEPFGVAMVLIPMEKGTTDPVITIGETTMESCSPCRNPSLKPLQESNPSASCLPLLEACAGGRPGKVFLPYLNGKQRVIEIC